VWVLEAGLWKGRTFGGKVPVNFSWFKVRPFVERFYQFEFWYGSARLITYAAGGRVCGDRIVGEEGREGADP
jgi:hypothetical protein